jgi:dipeptidase
MKIKDIILEDKVGDIPPRLQQATVGMDKFRDAQFADRVYELNRVMMAVAAADGINPLAPEVDGESWAGRNNLAFPYTPEEQKMLKDAFGVVGSHYEDLNNGDFKSRELNSTNKTSPVAKPKKNKYGV